MSRAYQPHTPFNVPAQLYKRSTRKVNGVNQERFTKSVIFMCGAKSYGGTEKVVNDVYVIEDTWTIDTWFNPKFSKGDRIRFLDTDNNTDYEILASPENIDRRGIYMRFKVVAISG